MNKQEISGDRLLKAAQNRSVSTRALVLSLLLLHSENNEGCESITDDSQSAASKESARCEALNCWIRILI